MTFRDTTNTYDSLTHYVDFLCGLTSGETTQFPLADRAREANTWKYRVALWIWNSQDAWDFDDSQNSNFNIATTTIVNNQRDYTLPTTALSIDRVELKDSGGNYYRIWPVDETQIPRVLTNYGETSTSPNRYWIRKRSIWLDPPPSTTSLTAAAGLKIYFRREINEFTGSTTTTEIGFGEPFDRAVALGVAVDYATVRGLAVLPDLYFQLFGGVKNGVKINGLKDEIEQHFSRRLVDKKSIIRPKMEKFI